MRISRTQRFKIAKIAKKYKLKLVMLFGSFASGKNTKDSDLDIGVLGLSAIAFEEQINIINEFSLIFNREIDLSVLNNANPLLIFEASKNSMLLYGRKSEFMEFKLYAYKVYNDYAPFFELERRLNKRIVNAYAT